MKSMSNRTLVTLGLLIAIEIVLSRFLSINAWNIKIGFNFIPIAMAGILYGPLAGGLVGACGDFLGATLFPIGAYFPGFTLTSFLIGVMFGLCLHKRFTSARLIIAVGVNQLILGLLVNTLWISILYNSEFVPLFFTRIIQCAILLPVQFVVIRAIYPLINRIGIMAENGA